MATEIPILVPALPESVATATVVAWHARPGQHIAQDANIVDLETDKVVLEVPCPVNGTLHAILVETGNAVSAGQQLAIIQVRANGDSAPPDDSPTPGDAVPNRIGANKAAPPPTQDVDVERLPPGARFTAMQTKIDLAAVKGTGRADAVTKEDLLTYQAQQAPTKSPKTGAKITPLHPPRREERIAMAPMRRRIAERLLHAKNTMAMLTTVNEINLAQLNALRNRMKDDFHAQYGVKLGFMSFFVKAVTQALLRSPTINASIDGTDIVYHHFCDISIAIATDKGLVTPVLRDAEHLSFAAIEQHIAAFADQARAGRLQLDALQGGTFTITNGGTFGSLLSTPIINPPQSAILGMHAIKERPIADNGQIVIAPMMYVALSYDHRLIDGKNAIGFLVDLKKQLENPARMLLNI